MRATDLPARATSVATCTPAVPPPSTTTSKVPISLRPPRTSSCGQPLACGRFHHLSRAPILAGRVGRNLPMLVPGRVECTVEVDNRDDTDVSVSSKPGEVRTMRSIWAGAISCGRVVIPVKLYAATEQRDITFRQVHRKDGARIQFRRVCTLDGEEVPYSDIAKGYELPTGDMVVLTDEDLADLPLVTAHRIEVLHFAPSAQVEPIYAAKSYYTEPEPTGARAYVLFRDALENSGKVAVAKVALRQREALAALRVREGVITLEALLWPDEGRQPDFAFLDEDIEVRSQELKMAASLIDTMTEDFDPDQYHDSYREALEEVVRAKVEGNEIVRPAGVEPPSPKGQPADLTEILRASVAALKAGRDTTDKQADKQADKETEKPKPRT